MNLRVCVVVVVLIALSIGIAMTVREDRYSGRTASEWLLTTRDTEAAESLQAATAIRGIPRQKLFPLLHDWMRARDGSWKQTVSEFLSKQHFIKFQFLSARDKRAAAFRVVALLGPEAKEFLPELSAVLASPQPENVFDAAFALATIGTDGKSALEYSPTNGTRQAMVARRAAQEMLNTIEFTTATQHWSTQTFAEVVRWRVQFNLKCLGFMRPRPAAMSPDAALP